MENPSYTDDQRKLARDLLQYQDEAPGKHPGEVMDYNGDGGKLLDELIESLQTKSEIHVAKAQVKIANEIKVAAIIVVEVLLGHKEFWSGVNALTTGLSIPSVVSKLYDSGAIKHEDVEGVRQFFIQLEALTLNANAKAQGVNKDEG